MMAQCHPPGQRPPLALWLPVPRSLLILPPPHRIPSHIATAPVLPTIAPPSSRPLPSAGSSCSLQSGTLPAGYLRILRTLCDSETRPAACRLAFCIVCSGPPSSSTSKPRTSIVDQGIRTPAEPKQQRLIRHDSTRAPADDPGCFSVRIHNPEIAS
ncbi:hypothetical protein CCHR01_02915 [Colletotrichum chrysophilum]|uniref:Uncharacterized protein n=1 Tax=Colletotrichum chrysophilum TaxID=1836956 RepID=A0AAD9EJV0_9PEZI|nr:hypothetical protein CCHR01_02915 [Colletotrichum chrysophilum]